jgi:gliding motility-associated-like protein
MKRGFHIHGNRVITLKHFLFLLILLLNGTLGYAQFQAANWLLYPQTKANFISQSPEFSTDNAVDGVFMATYSDLSGRLILYSNGKTVWNSSGVPYKNGESIYPFPGYNTLIVPKPESDSIFYIFNTVFVTTTPGNSGINLVYSIVDLRANNRLGEVVERGKILYGGMHGFYAVSGTCDGRTLWLVGDVDSNVFEGSDRMLIFRVTKDGIDGPYSNLPTGLSIGNSSGYRFSPDAKKFVFSIDGNFDTRTILADFNFDQVAREPFTNLRSLPFSRVEFSPNSKFLYLCDNSYKRVSQYDIEKKTTTVLFSHPGIGFNIQLASDGKIYIPLDNAKRWAIIHQPNLPGLSCQADVIGISVPSDFLLPQFPAHFFHQGSQRPEAGLDKEICMRDRVTLGVPSPYGGAWKWYPETDLLNPNSLTPEFIHTDTTKSKFVYQLTYQENNCAVSDMIVIQITPKPERPVIDGSKSVCPGVTAVDYWIAAKPGFTYEWSVWGGTIHSNSAMNDSVKVNWGATNPKARVNLRTIDAKNCKSDIGIFPVRINVELKTQIPQGLDSVCDNLMDRGVVYSINKTSGSEYTWGIGGGDLIIGQGTNRVTIKWKDLAPNFVWVKEKSVTVDTVCFGISDTLRVTRYKDPATLSIDWVSVDSLNERNVLVATHANRMGRLKKINLLKKERTSNAWVDQELALPMANLLTLRDLLTQQKSYDFKMEYLNGCEEWKETAQHNTIFLEGQSSKDTDWIELEWSPYHFGTNGSSLYQVFAAVPGSDFEWVKSINSDSSISVDATQSFFYSVRLKALSADKKYTAYSNKVQVELVHELFVPNVITPNGDGVNDFFHIKNLHLYGENRLTIVNRYGELITQTFNYENDWRGDGVSEGVYFYHLLIPAIGKEMRGWLQIIR